MVFLYGPPGVGKLTVSTELARITGYRVFHNHLTIDAVIPLFDFGTPPFGRLLRVMREAVLAEAAREAVDVIFTSVYNHPEDVDYMQQMCRAVEHNGGRVCLVQLLCELDELEQRLIAPHRLQMGKLTNVDRLRSALAELDLTTPVPGRESLRIDNTRVPAEQVASAIVRHFGLSISPGAQAGADSSTAS